MRFQVITCVEKKVIIRFSKRAKTLFLAITTGQILLDVHSQVFWLLFIAFSLVPKMAARWRKTQHCFVFDSYAQTNVETDLDQDDKDAWMTFKNNIFETCGRGSKSKAFAGPKLKCHLDEAG